MIDPSMVDRIRSLGQEWVATMGLAVRGKSIFLRKFLTAWVAGGHVLIEDVPGVGKTTAVKALAATIQAPPGLTLFRRIQFTPDLLPYDITGVDIFSPGKRGFEFQEGPIFSILILADEINRATPKVQSALLEAMEERTVTVGNATRRLHELFMVAATQNPTDMEGTYPLPQAQLDRFLMKLALGYPEAEEEEKILSDFSGKPDALDRIKPLFSLEELLEMRNLASRVFVDPRLSSMARRVLESSRNHTEVRLGLSPRAGIHWFRAARVWALWQGRDFVIDQDLIDIGPEVLTHRLGLVRHDTDPKALLTSWIRDVFTG